MSNILITGGLGFIGSNLAHKCVADGYNVTLLSLTNRKIANISGIEDKVRLVLKDVKDIEEEVEGQNYIFHCASTVDNYNIHEEPYKDVDINCNGTIAVLEACRHRNRNARIIYTSTFFVNGNVDELPMTPKSPCNPRGLYPATKLAAEHFCRIYNKVFDMNSVIARLSNVLGVREQRDNNKKAAFNRMINTAVNDGTIKLYDNGRIKRDYIYVDDVIDGLLTIAKKGEVGKIYYIGRGEGVKFKKIVDMMIEESGSGHIKSVTPPKFHQASGINDFWCDNTPLKELGWKPKVSIREGIKRVIEEYRIGKNDK